MKKKNLSKEVLLPFRFVFLRHTVVLPDQLFFLFVTNV